MTTGLIETGPVLPSSEAGRLTRAAGLALTALCVALAVTDIVDLRLTSAVHRTPVSWSEVLMVAGPRFVLLAALLFPVLALARQFPIWPPTLRALVAHAAGFVGLSVLHAIAYTLVLRHLDAAGVGFSLHMQLLGTMLSSMPVLILLYASAVGAAYLVNATLDRHAHVLHAAQLQGELSTMHVAALRAQLHPHFLYNSLHAISALIGDDQNQRALQATEHLADLLHAAFRDDGRVVIPLSEEMQLVDRYLALQQMRFADRLVVSSHLEPDAACGLVPPLLLQPIVENAVLHGRAAAGALTVRIDARLRDGRLHIVVENDGARVLRGWSAEGGKGVGIPNTRGRLATLYGAGAELRLEPRDQGGVVATIVLPLRTT